MAKLEMIEGIRNVYAEKLRKIGVRSTSRLLAKGATPMGRKEIAEASGIDGTYLMEWINHCDLFRIKGIGEEYADLLEEAGVDTVPELAQRNAANLYQKILEVNTAKKLVRRIPTESQVAGWVEQAKTLPRIVEY